MEWRGEGGGEAHFCCLRHSCCELKSLFTCCSKRLQLSIRIGSDVRRGLRLAWCGGIGCIKGAKMAERHRAYVGWNSDNLYSHQIMLGPESSTARLLDGHASAQSGSLQETTDHKLLWNGILSDWQKFRLVVFRDCWSRVGKGMTVRNTLTKVLEMIAVIAILRNVCPSDSSLPSMFCVPCHTPSRGENR